MMIDCDHIGYEVSWEDSLLDVVDNFIHRVFQRTVCGLARFFGNSYQFLLSLRSKNFR